MFGCRRCGKKGFEQAVTAATLAGEVFAHLCDPCRTGFAAFLRAHPAWDDALALNARECHYNSLAISGSPVDEARWRELCRDQNAAVLGLHGVALGWLGGGGQDT